MHFPSDVAGLIHAHPTQGEALGEAHLALAGKPLHAHSYGMIDSAALAESELHKTSNRAARRATC